MSQVFASGGQKYWSFSFNISPSNEHSGLISFRMDWLDLLAVQGTLKSLLQHHSSKVSGKLTFLLLYLFCSVQSHGRVRLSATPWTAARQASLSITNSRSILKLMSVESVMPSNHLILSSPSPPTFNFSPVSDSFQMSQLFASGGQSIGVSASASVLPMNIQD